MILVYTHKVTPRLKYIFKHLFTRTLLIPVGFTTKIEEFVAHNGLKMSFTKSPLGNEFFVKCADLLFEQGVNDIEINIQKWDEIPCFFKCSAKASIPFDIFSASFYLISRYEEYLPHVKDKHERFSAVDSLAFNNGFLEKPVIDIWAYKLLDALQEKFPDFNYTIRNYKFISTVDVDNAFAYKHKSFIRTVGGFFSDLFQFKLLHVFKRFVVFFNIKKDPFDTFNEIIAIQKKYHITTIFFFLVGNYTTFDKNNSASNRKFRLLIKDMVDYAFVGLHPSYFTMKDALLLNTEKKRLEEIINTPIQYSRQHYLRLNLPETYQNLVDLEIAEDYSMGYADAVGFRASTCTPFYFYDLDFEIQTPLKVYPFAVMDTTLNDYLGLSAKQSLGKIRELKDHVKAVNGTFILLFHNETLSDYLRWKGWKRLYESAIKIALS